MPDLPDPDRRKHPARILFPLERAADDAARQHEPQDDLPNEDAADRRTASSANPQSLFPSYIELRCKTNFSFLRGASHPEELVERAMALGYPALGVADVNTLAGVVRAHCAAQAAGLKLLIGSEVRPVDGPPVTLYAINRTGYGRLARLITVGRRRAKKGECHLANADIWAHADDLISIVHAAGTAGAVENLAAYRAAFGDRLYLGVQLHRGSADAACLARMQSLAKSLRIPLVAVNDVHYHDGERRFLQDVLTCVREGCKLTEAGYCLFPNGERYLKTADEMAALFRDCPDALARPHEIADRCTFSLDELRYEYPPEVCPQGRSPAEYLAELTWAGARRYYGQAIPDKVRDLVTHELRLIGELGYEHYFLTVWDLVRFARDRGILCQGRGSAANSAVCFCLGITSVDPGRIDVLFERFVSAERNEPPDIDVDFEHERREEVIQYIYGKYGRERAGIAAEVITYRPRSAVRDVGKVLGLSLDRLDAISAKVEWWSDPDQIAAHLAGVGLDPSDYTMRCLVGLCRQIVGFPRHLSQHVGGFVMTAGPLCELAPIENAAMPDRTFIEWDKDDIDALGILKVDCLALGMLTAIRKCFALIGQLELEKKGLRDSGIKGLREGTSGREVEQGVPARRAEGASVPAERGVQVLHGENGAAAERPGRTAPGPRTTSSASPQSLNPSIPQSLSLADVPPEDPAVYDMICHADTVGVFQVESRAQMSMLPRLRPRCFYDLVIEVAIVRPGPIQGGMVHPYLRRRNGEEPVSYPSAAVKDVLRKTLGVPLFQEQAMKLAMVAGGFTPGEADQLRRSMAAWRRSGSIEKFRDKMIAGMRANGYTQAFAEQLFSQFSGFAEYGFPESHAASFALLVYVSAWLKCYHPAAFAAALINSQPMGFYAPAQLVRDAREHGVEVRPVDVNHSAFDCTLEVEKKRLRDSGIEGLRAGPTGTEVEQGVRARRAVGASVPAERDGQFHAESIAAAERPSKTTPVPPTALSASPQSLPLSEANGPALRLGFRLIKGLPQDAITRLVAARNDGPFTSVADLARRSGLSRAVLARLAAGDAFNSLGLDRREALWQVLALDDELPLFAGAEWAETPADLPRMGLDEQVVHDYETTGLSLKAHPMSLIRPRLRNGRIAAAKQANRCPQGRRVAVAGLVLVRQRPSTALGIVFMTIEDETGVVNLVIRPKVYERFRAAARSATAVIATGRIEREGEVVHLQVERLESVTDGMKPKVRSRDFH